MRFKYYINIKDIFIWDLDLILSRWEWDIKYNSASNCKLLIYEYFFKWYICFACFSDIETSIIMYVILLIFYWHWTQNLVNEINILLLIYIFWDLI